MSPLTKSSSPNDVLSATFCQAIGRGVKLHSELPKAALLQGAIRQQSKTSQPSHSAFISYVVNLNHARSDSSPDHAELSLTRLIHFFVCLGGFCLFVCFWGFLIYPPAPTQAHWSRWLQFAKKSACAWVFELVSSLVVKACHKPIHLCEQGVAARLPPKV